MNALREKETGARNPYFDLDLLGADPPGTPGALAQRFIVPPLSVLDGRTASWQWRKRAWIEALRIQPALSFLRSTGYEVTPPEPRRGRRGQWVGPPPVPAWVVRAVLASEELTSGEKLVWLVYRQLADYSSKGGERCVATAAQIGRYLGMESRNVEKHRRLLKAAGLLGSDPRPGKRGESWWATLPGWGGPWTEDGVRGADTAADPGTTALDATIRCARNRLRESRIAVRSTRI